MEDDDFEKKMIQSVEKIEKRAPRRHNLSLIPQQDEDEEDVNENEDDDIKQKNNTVILSQLSLQDEAEHDSKQNNVNDKDENEWKTPNNSELMVDKAFELAMIQSTKMVEKTVTKTNHDDVDDTIKSKEASYLLDNDSCDEQLLLLSCTKAEQNYDRKFKLRECKNDNNIKNKDEPMTPSNPLIDKCLFASGKLSDLSFSSRSNPSLNTSLLSMTSEKNFMSNKSALSVKRNLDEIFVNAKDAELTPIQPNKRQRLNDSSCVSFVNNDKENNNDNDISFGLDEDEWDDFVSKIDKQLQSKNKNVSNDC